LQKGYTWFYNGFITQKKVIDENNFGSYQEYAVAFYDTLGAVVWEEDYIRDQDRIFWSGFRPQIDVIPYIRFEPAIPISPISNKPGDSRSLTVREIRQDSLRSIYQVQVTYEVESVESVITPAAQFDDCLRIHININYLDTVERPYLAGDYYIWYAHGVGIVRYIMPGDQGNLIKAILAERTIP